MSVVRALRNQSAYEYDNTFNLIYKDIVFRMQRISKRKQEYVAKPLCDIMNKSFDNISKISYGFFRGRINEKYNLISLAINTLFLRYVGFPSVSTLSYALSVEEAFISVGV